MCGFKYKHIQMENTWYIYSLKLEGFIIKYLDEK